MKKVLLIIIALIFTFSVNAQKKTRKVEEFNLSTSYEEAKKKFKSTFIVTKKIILEDGSSLFIGDTLKLGKSASKISNDYTSIWIGNAMSGFINISSGHSQFTYILDEIRINLLYGDVKCTFKIKDPYAKGMMATSYTASDFSIKLGELINPNAPITREQAIEKLKESKDLLDLEIITQEEYNLIKSELTPLIKSGN
tara:strand:- start:2170 stop:2760 length:591 start_codon:yes stop_codon:yes gene_type:complete